MYISDVCNIITGYAYSNLTGTMLSRKPMTHGHKMNRGYLTITIYFLILLRI